MACTCAVVALDTYMPLIEFMFNVVRQFYDSFWDVCENKRGTLFIPNFLEKAFYSKTPTRATA